MNPSSALDGQHRDVAIAVGSAALAVVAGGLVTLAPGYVLLLPAAAIAGFAGLRWPGTVLAAGCLGALFAGQFATVAIAADRLLLFCGILSAFGMLRRRLEGTTALFASGLVLISWLGLRLAMESGLGTVKPLLTCAAVLLTVRECVARRGQKSFEYLSRNFGVAGIVFIMASSILGQYDLTGLRFQGVSGNPNRMVFGLTLFLPFVLGAAKSSKRIAVRVVAVAAVGMSVLLVFRSGSTQGAVGLIFLMIALCVYVARRLEPVFLAWCGLVLASALAAWAYLTDVVSRLSPDTLTLSGRTRIFEAAWTDIQSHPLIGSGLVHVTAQDVMDRSAHNALIGIAASAGIFAGLLWLGLIFSATASGVRQLWSGALAGAAPILLAVLQFVQSVEYVALTWAVLGVAVMHPKASRSSNAKG